MRENKIIEFTAPRSGVRIDVCISDQNIGISRSQAKTLIESKRVRVSGVVVDKPSTFTQAGQIISIDVPPVKKMDLIPVKVGIEILFEDEHLAVVYKPAGISVHPSATEEGPTVVHGLLHELKTLSQIGGVTRPGIVHRIDKGTSGVLVISKNDSAHLHLAKQFKEHSIVRKYHALVYGVPQKKSGTIESLIGRHPVDRKKMTSKVKQGRKAITHWKLLKSNSGVSLIECSLETGRTHQIRVHLSEMGHGIIGDPVYGNHPGRAKALAGKYSELAKKCAEIDHQLLHAFYLEFTHPQTDERKKFEHAVPNDFKEILQEARIL